jgi:hypothetical protein
VRALEHALRDLRALERGALSSVATDLMIMASERSQGGRSGDRMPDDAAVLLLLGRVAYVLAAEGLRG